MKSLRSAGAAAAAAGAAASAVAIAALVAITVFDVGGRYLFNKPLLGAVELSEFLLVIVAFAGLAWAERRNAHIAVDFFTARLPQRAQRALDAFGALVGALFWGCVGWRAAVQAEHVRGAHELSLSWHLPTWPFYLVVTLGSAMMVLLLAVRLLRGAPAPTETLPG